MTELYHGWTNRETWAFNLHWNNDEDLYKTVRDWAKGWVENYSIAEDEHMAKDAYDRLLGSYIIDRATEWWAAKRQELMALSVRGLTIDLNTHPVLLWERETGSVWRVDARETGAFARGAIE